MARFFPVRSQCQFDTPGERRFAERLEKLLEDDYLCWSNVPVGPKARYPDFVVLHPKRGILVLEVKDWKLATIQSMTRGKVILHTSSGIKTVANPMLQARSYVMEVDLALKKDPLLRQSKSSPRPGDLIMPWGWGVVLTNITRRQFEQTDLHDVFDPQRVIFQDEMTETADPEAFQQRLWNMFPHVFPCTLTLPQIDRVRYHLYPEVRVSALTGQFGLFAESDAPIPSLIKVMDLQQEQLARSLGEGHRVIHGAAGSGKTMILGYRCEQLARVSPKPILVLCFNRSLATYNVDKPKWSPSADRYAAQLVENTIDGVDRGQIPRAQYSAVLIDEGHDFAPEWFKLIVQMADPATNALLVLYDDAQSIYRGKGKKTGLNFSFASVGIQAQGRTTILKLNYRNTLEVLSVARAFATELLSGRDAGEDGVPIIVPESAGRRGAFPELIQCEGHWQEWDCLVTRIRDEQANGRMLSDMAIIYRSSSQAQAAEYALTQAGIAYASGANSKARSELYGSEDSVKIVSMHSSKGLEFGLVLIPGLGEMPKKGEAEADEARLLYVAMTRAIDRLVMTYQEHSDFTKRVQEAIGGVKEGLGAMQEGCA